jgi:outer membrane protein TolC
MRRNTVATVVMAGVLAAQLAPPLVRAQSPFGGWEPIPSAAAPPAPATPLTPAHPPALKSAPTPVLAESRDPTGLKPAKPEELDQSLPINLATALRLADARPLVIEAARAAVETQYGIYKQAQVLWLPSIYVGIDYQRQDGAQQNALTGLPIIGPRNEFFVGAGARAVFALSDAIYAPLAERQVLRSRNVDVQSAKNQAVLSVATAYFDVQQARGILAGTQDSVVKAHELSRRIASLGRGLAPLIEVDRAQTTLAEFEQLAATARQDWRFNSASLTRVLRLNPGAIVVPLEPPHLQVTLISPKDTVESLIPIGLTNRPELESQQALVRATLERLRQERMRPLIPSLVLQSNATPGQLLGAGAYGTVTNSLNNWGGRSSWDAEVVWEFKNLGFGNRGLIEQRRGEQRQALVELFRVQDQVAADISQAHALVEAAAMRVVKAEMGLKAATLSYAGNLKGLSETVRAGELLVLVNRPQEVVAALQQLQQAYVNYYTSANDFSRAQFRLFWALGFSAQGLSCSQSFGAQTPVDTSRPPQMAPVQAPLPCQDCPK